MQVFGTYVLVSSAVCMCMTSCDSVTVYLRYDVYLSRFVVTRVHLVDGYDAEAKLKASACSKSEKQARIHKQGKNELTVTFSSWTTSLYRLSGGTSPSFCTCTINMSGANTSCLEHGVHVHTARQTLVTHVVHSSKAAQVR